MPKLRRLYVLATMVALATPAMALECPVLAKLDDPALAGVVAHILPDGVDLDAPDALETAIFDLKQAGVPDDAVLDNLIASYCLTTDGQADLSDDAKTERLEDFSQSATQLVFGQSQ
ncbi:hypothetical protein SAMN05428969_3002 [Devosia sp. YR412]|uniref:hypothetical protein n=1 Tax=Devosia sp. YR412 TaxID=1881030 RepID=UPI0008CBAEA1|nr:hypothetical protein [Devosia sp. YR412]SEQ41723.1 hypothetical protein SAMN05428969_3002 [Devosia sp. YR412]